MVKRTLLILSLICLCTCVKGQMNLVRNGGFEQYSRCPYSNDQIQFSNYWNSIDTNWSPLDSTIADPEGVPEYCNICSAYYGISIPLAQFYYQYPHSGNGMAQEIMYYDNYYGDTAFYQRDYLQGHLCHTLTPSKSYCVTFYVNMANSAGYAVNHIGAYFDNGSIDSTSDSPMPQTEYTPQILDTAVISDTLNWVKVQGSFVANGTEKFITIGNFFDLAHTSAVSTGVVNHWSEYLIDDVSVIASDATANAGPDVNIAPGDSVWIGDTTGDGMPCYWYVLGGTAPIDSGGRILVHPSDSTTYVVEMDLCGNVTYDTVNVRVNDLAINPLTPKGQLSLYPNPVGSELNISAGEQIRSVVISNVVGQQVLSQQCNAAKVMVSVADLLPGIYFVRVNDVVVRRFVKE